MEKHLIVANEYTSILIKSGKQEPDLNSIPFTECPYPFAEQKTLGTAFEIPSTKTLYFSTKKDLVDIKHLLSQE